MSTLKTSNIQDTSGSNNSTPEEINQGRAKAWVNFNGTGTVAIRDNFNVSSITDNGTGDYTATFTTAMANANYAYTYGITYNSTTRESVVQVQTVAASSIRILTGYSYTSPGAVDVGSVSIAVFGD